MRYFLDFDEVGIFFCGFATSCFSGPKITFLEIQLSVAGHTGRILLVILGTLIAPNLRSVGACYFFFDFLLFFRRSLSHCLRLQIPYHPEIQLSSKFGILSLAIFTL